MIVNLNSVYIENYLDSFRNKRLIGSRLNIGNIF